MIFDVFIIQNPQSIEIGGSMTPDRRTDLGFSHNVTEGRVHPSSNNSAH